MRTLPLILAGIAAIAAPSATAQVPDTTAIVVRATTMLDGVGGARSNVDVVVRRNRIVEVRTARGRADIDLGTHVLAPGLIDTHVHLGWYITTRGRLHQRN